MRRLRLGLFSHEMKRGEYERLVGIQTTEKKMKIWVLFWNGILMCKRSSQQTNDKWR